MSLTLLQLLDEAIIASGTMDTQSTYYGNSDKQAKKALAAANEAVAQLRAAYNWEKLMTTKSITLTSSQYYAIADDVEFIQPNSFVNATSGVKYKSISPERAAEIESGAKAADHDEIFIRDGSFKFMATVTSGETVEYKYQLNTAVVNSGGDKLKRFTADDNTVLVPDELVILLTAIILRDNEGSDSSVLRERFSRLFKRFTGADNYRTKLELFRRSSITWRR